MHSLEKVVAGKQRWFFVAQTLRLLFPRVYETRSL